MKIFILNFYFSKFLQKTILFLAHSFVYFSVYYAFIMSYSIIKDPFWHNTSLKSYSLNPLPILFENRRNLNFILATLLPVLILGILLGSYLYRIFFLFWRMGAGGRPVTYFYYKEDDDGRVTHKTSTENYNNADQKKTSKKLFSLSMGCLLLLTCQMSQMILLNREILLHVNEFIEIQKLRVEEKNQLIINGIPEEQHDQMLTKTKLDEIDSQTLDGEFCHPSFGHDSEITEQEKEEDSLDIKIPIKTNDMIKIFRLQLILTFILFPAYNVLRYKLETKPIYGSYFCWIIPGSGFRGLMNAYALIIVECVEFAFETKTLIKCSNIFMSNSLLAVLGLTLVPLIVMVKRDQDLDKKHHKENEPEIKWILPSIELSINVLFIIFRSWILFDAVHSGNEPGEDYRGGVDKHGFFTYLLGSNTLTKTFWLKNVLFIIMNSQEVHHILKDNRKKRRELENNNCCSSSNILSNNK